MLDVINCDRWIGFKIITYVELLLLTRASWLIRVVVCPVHHSHSVGAIMQVLVDTRSFGVADRV